MSEPRARRLIADDNKVNRLLLARSLEILGHEVTMAENGRVVLELLARNAFDLLLLDIDMPELDGYQVMEHLATNSSQHDIPVIVTSAREDIASVARCIEMGADDYLNKPLNPVLLKARVNSSLEKKRLRDLHKDLVRRFVTKEIADDVLKSGFSLSGRRVCGTVLFCDMRGFTSLVETLALEESLELINVYHTLMFEAITSHGGVVNQIVGDGLMALFGVPTAIPEPALAAARAGVEMIEMIQLLNSDRAIQGLLPVEIGTGITTGDMIAGYVGTHSRATYTCIGDAVNMAARLEAFTKEAGHPILIDGATRQELKGQLLSTALGAVNLKGKAFAVEVFALACGA